MSSMFDSNVYDRRKATPWARIRPETFMESMIWNGDAGRDAQAVLSVFRRGDVATREWWRLEWTGEDDTRHYVEASDLDLLMWRAAQRECDVREKVARRNKNAAREEQPDGGNPA